jgi:hypothetical protein
MDHFDADYTREVIKRLERISPEAVPQWGQLRRDTLIEHLIWAIMHSLGRSKKVPYFGNWFTVNVVAPLVLRGWVPIVKNLHLPNGLVKQGIAAREPGDLAVLRGLMEEYINLVQADELQPGTHPFFGNIGVDGWDCIHVQHFEHHLRQFGV